MMTTERDKIRAEVLDAWNELTAEEREERPPLTPERLNELADAVARGRSEWRTSAIPYAQDAWFNLHGWRGTVPEAEAMEQVAVAVIAQESNSRETAAELASLVEMELDHLRNEIARAIAPGGRASWLRIDTAEQIHTPITAETDDGPILAWDAVAANWLETRLGAREAAREMRALARERWSSHERERDLWTPGHEPTVAGLWHLWQRGAEGVPRIVIWVCEAVWQRDREAIGRRGSAEHATSTRFATQLALFGKRSTPRRETHLGETFDAYPMPGGATWLVSRDDVASAPVVSDGAARAISSMEIGLAELRLVHYVTTCIHEALRSGRPWTDAQRIQIPRGRALAKALGMGDDGRAAERANEAVIALARVNIRDRRGHVVGLWGRPDEEAPSPGRPGSFYLSLRELLLPWQLRKIPGYSVLAPMCDTLPPDEWSPARSRENVARLGFSMTAAWRTQAGRRHGREWLERPGLLLTDSVWAEVGHGLDRERTVHELAESGWWEYSDRLLIPGKKLTKMAAGLNRSAEMAKENSKKKKTGKRH